MAVDLHLFSSPGDGDVRYIIEASRPYLEGRPEAILAYLPLASLFAERWQAEAEDAFSGLAQLEMVNAELMSQAEIESILRRSALVYIPGGNTFLLNHRLHLSGVMPFLRKKVQGGLPLVGFSAGAVLCGPNILTSRDLNTVGTVHFDGLNAVPFSFLVHYAGDAYGQRMQDDWLADYHFFHDNPVILLCDGAYVRVEGRKTCLVRGEAWLLEKNQEKSRLQPGEMIPA